MTAFQLFPSDSELTRYLMGESTPGETYAIEQWLEGALERRQRLEDLRAVLQATEPRRMTWDAVHAWKGLAERLEPPGKPVIVRGPRRSLPNPLYRTLVAAGIAGVLAGGWYLSDTLASRSAAADAPGSIVERRTGLGERVVFHLPDGTGVTLGPVSRLRYARPEYGRPSRAVELEGDGYFQVVHDETRPFVVHAAGVSVRDLGTRFVVRARPDGARIDVGVAEGLVAMSLAAAPDDSVILRPGDAAHTNGIRTPLIERSVPFDRYFGWTEGRLVFERAPLVAVAAELERWYDVEIELVDHDLANRVLTASFRDKPVTEVLDLIAASLSLTVTQAGKRFLVSTREVK